MEISIKNFKAEEIIYESSNSTIYLLESGDNPVIVKVLQERYPSPRRVVQFNNEYEFTKNLKIQGIRKAIKQTKFEGRHALVLEYFSGIPIRVYFKENKIKPEDFLKLAIQITSALEDIHAHNIIHRDIGGGNILVNQESGTTKIIDFGISSRIDLRIEHQGNPETLEGTLAYISPEQTGRMNRAVDYRTDLYSLGAVFYELLTGRPPFLSDDPMVIVHAHIARTPEPLCDIAPGELPGNYPIPRVFSNIVNKLMEKNAEDRYQSAAGLRVDLERCLSQISRGGRLEEFSLGREDYSARFVIPQKLYGRESELETLTKSFERVSQGAVELMLVAGYSGVGKSALVHELHKPLTGKRGYIVSGKFEQFQRNIPFYAFSQALSEFARHLLTESAERLVLWQHKILDAVGNNGQVLVDLIPDLQTVIGKQPPVPELSPGAGKNRFLLVFQQFIKSISHREHPLVIFLDDLQWADIASLELLQTLMTDFENQFLQVIGAYRDNEVDRAHPLSVSIADIRKKKGAVYNITLQNLSRSNLDDLLADTLLCAPDYLDSLGDLVYEKTRGNAFFSGAFIKSLYEEGLLSFSHDKKNWTWDIEKIKTREFSDNVAELMTGKIEKLPDSTRRVLRLAACIGARFSLAMTATIFEKDPEATLAALWEAIDEGLLLPLDGAYQIPETAPRAHFRFLHDRVQQAAYSLIPPEERKAVHLQIGRLLVKNTNAAEFEERVFDLVNHLNEGKELINTNDERIKLAALNLSAGKKARNSAAYDAAKRYLLTGYELIKEQGLENHYATGFELLIDLGEVEFLTGNFEASDKLLDLALKSAARDLDRSRVYLIKIAQLAGQGEYVQAVSASIRALNMFGLDIPDIESEELERAIQTELDLYSKNMENRGIAELYELPDMENENIRACTQIIATAMDSIVIGVPQYAPLFTSKMINLSIEYGLSEFVPAGYAFFSTVQAIRFKDYTGAYELVTLAYKINREKFPRLDILTKINSPGAVYSLLKKHFRDGLEHAEKAFQVSLEVGDFPYAGYNCYFGTLLMSAFNVNEALLIAPPYVAFLKKVNNIPMLLLTQLWIGYALFLQDTVQASLETVSFDFEDFTETAYLDTLGTAPILVSFHVQARLKALVLKGLYAEALGLIKTREEWQASLLKFDLHYTHDVALFMGVTVTALYNESTAEEQSEFRLILEESLELLRELVVQTKVNFEHAYLILQAQQARIDNRPLDAMQLFEDAVESARRYEFPQNEALATELAARFYLEQGAEKVAALYLADSLYVRRRWGASALVKRLEVTYPALLSQVTRSRTFSPELTVAAETISSASENAVAGILDLNTVLKSSRAISREINLEKLLTRIMSIIIENAGARKAFLIMQNDNSLMIEASIDLDSDKVEVLKSASFESCANLSQAIVRYVIRSGQNTVLLDAREENVKEGVFADDPYIKKFKPRSVLCMPLRHKDKIGGALYLENNLSAAAFTEERTELLNILLAQAAVSLENAKIYEHLEELVKERTRELETTHRQLMETAHRAGKAEIAAGVLHNVGNSLTSALVPASLIKESLDKSHLPSLARVTDLLSEHSADLSNFLRQDQKGRKLPDYCDKLSNVLLQEQEGIAQKLERLTASLEQIKESIRRLAPPSTDAD